MDIQNVARVNFTNSIYSFENHLYLYAVNCKSHIAAENHNLHMNYGVQCVDYLIKNKIDRNMYSQITAVVLHGYQMFDNFMIFDFLP